MHLVNTVRTQTQQILVQLCFAIFAIKLLQVLIVPLAEVTGAPEENATALAVVATALMEVAGGRSSSGFS